MDYCETCSDDHTCLTCGTGYKVDSTTKKCVCDISQTTLSFCLTCFSPTVCTKCVSNSYFLNSADHLCYPCSTFDPVCLTCSDQNICTSCQSGYTPITNTDSTSSCILCSTLIDECLTCSSQTICTDCDIFYGLNSINQC